MRDHDSMSRALMELHWLPVDKRIQYKLLLYTYKALHGLVPEYLCELVVPFAPRRVLRSAEIPGKYGSRSFVGHLQIHGTYYAERVLPGLRIVRL